ncbi:uncharacterized protein LOC131198613 [Ahaetulla prasina]|uniref:uncharacterized protein LOC131198613 n=1 Tax=Ahaetulla prasina TaxID=499056 RepID=UPI0026476B1F|nr:uncharacterized protein LOC131198613 [Ahaetulla prasina]XP_058039421.1 uncharacterized protein LOC131198613 [Ahaetulla prasina]XP_058039422.1 uncharacterized protein LOC131198613 [Ahaetulla prasina]XP_058039423.1 uncharacterized protein LOC131198613 [Ahaetulla prasina]
MAGALPIFSPFVPSSEKWDEYIESFECFLHANDLADLSGARKRGYFLSSCGSEVFSTARALAAPQLVFELTWEALVEKLKNHYAPAPSRIARRHAFQHCVQKEEQTINAYMASLRSAALQCEFRDFLDDMLLDQLVCGVRDMRLQRRLLARKDLDLSTALSEARAAEMADDSAAELQRHQRGSLTSDRPLGVHHEDATQESSSEEEADVRRLNLRQRRQGDFPDKHLPNPCMGCGGDHARGDCKFKTAVCRRCGKRGHLARVCRATLPSSDDALERTKSQKPTRKPMARQRACFTASDSTDDVVSFATSTIPTNKIHLSVQLKGAQCDMEVDTGSSRSLIAWSTLKHLVPSLEKGALKPCAVTLRDYQEKTIPTLGMGRFRVAYQKFEGSLPLIVVRSDLPTLLGLDWFAALGLNVAGVHTTLLDVPSALASEFANVFEDTLGKYNGTPVSLQLDPQVQPIRLKPRRVPLAL